MEETNINLQRYDLTGRVSVVDGIARFNGNYSSVLLGAWNGNYVAIKVIKATSGQQNSTVKRKLLREVVVWGSTSHRNIHPFYGVANDPPFGPFGALISPWCRNGDACQFLSQNGPNMVMAARMNLWKGVIAGVAYLHGRNPPIVHGDLKPGNVLIDDAGNPRICDFGLARIFDNVSGSGMTTTSEHTGTTRYLAPELVASEESVPPTLASDVYALGCLGLEFIYLQHPFSHRPNNPRGHLMILQDLRRGLAPAAVPPHRTWPSHRVWPLISGLWSLDPSSRSSALTTAQLVERGDYALPPSVVQRVIAFVDAGYWDKYNVLHLDRWNPRTRCLYNLCLVSREYCGWATPVLYQTLWFRRDVTAAALYALSYSLNNSIISPLAYNRVAGGYGKYVENLILVTTENRNLRGEISATFRDILQIMPRLRLVHVGDGAVPPLHSLSTLDIDYWNDRIPIVDESAIITGFSYLQRLRIVVDNAGRTSDFPAASRLFLPHLRFLDILTFTGHDTLSVSFFLGALSGWKLPSLQYLDIESNGETHYVDALIGFLRSHGTVILYMTLAFYDGPAMLQDMLTTIFTLCTNLRSMRVHLMNIPAFDLRSSHPNLEKLHLTYSRNEADESVGFYNTLKLFKSMAPTLFPKLMEARLEKYLSYSTAFFYTGDEFITVRDGNEVSRHYDDGRIEIDMEATETRRRERRERERLMFERTGTSEIV